MKEIKIIVCEDKETFEKEIQEYLEKNFIVKHTNLAIALDTVQRLTNLGANKLKTMYYAYMEKEN